MMELARNSYGEAEVAAESDRLAYESVYRRDPAGWPRSP
jgi:hypothetical protein